VTDINLILPYPPSVNHYWGTKVVTSKLTKKAKGRKRLIVLRFLTKKAKQFRKDVALHVAEQIGRAPELRGRLAIIVRQHHGPGKVQDIDNCLKGLFDALEHCKIYRNDSQIDELLVVKKRRSAIGRVEVTIKPLGE
jgi:crossover junction endodeoxyribonuclease RusA